MNERTNPAEKSTNKKLQDLQKDITDHSGKAMTTNHGVLISNDTDSLKAGERGPTLMEDFIFREKMTHFDHERIPERIVHARGAGAHGYFQCYDDSLLPYTRAKFLTDPSRETPVFVRFSTVAGSRGSTDLPRDVRGFAVKFYTDEGNFDLVGNNIPVFFIQDAMKFPDVVHAVKPEPHNEIPQAASAHNTFWDFISLTPEAMHMIMWKMSDRAIPRSFRMMEGFGVHTFRLINEEGESHFVKFHWKPLLGVHSVAWDEAQKISGNDPDFHRRDLYDAIEAGHFPEWEFGVQIIPQADEHTFSFDLLDPTKIVPEELVPVQRIGKLVLNRNPDNFFAETEQVAFHPGHLVPGIDFTNDPLLQGRLFSYTDTQLIRLGGPNFHEIPINRPVNPVYNNQRDGYMRQQINTGKTAYHPNSMGGGCPFLSKATEGGFTHYQEKIDGHKIRARSKSFLDFFSQATLFYNSQSPAEKKHIISAFSFELGKVDIPEVQERMLVLIAHVDQDLARQVAEALGQIIPEHEGLLNHNFGADTDPQAYQPVEAQQEISSSEALSMANTVKDTVKSRKIAVLATHGVSAQELNSVMSTLKAEQAVPEIVALKGGLITDDEGGEHPVDKTFLTTASVLYDAVFIPGGRDSVNSLLNEPDAIHFINEAYRHCKAIGASGEGTELLRASFVGNSLKEGTDIPGVLRTEAAVDSNFMALYTNAVAQHRFWERELERKVPA